MTQNKKLFTSKEVLKVRLEINKMLLWKLQRMKSIKHRQLIITWFLILKHKANLAIVNLKINNKAYQIIRHI